LTEWPSMAKSRNRPMDFECMSGIVSNRLKVDSYRKSPFCVFILLTKEALFWIIENSFFPLSQYYQIYAPRLDDPSSGTFESCSSDTFQINGPCAYQICYVYLYRSGSNGWKPDTVKINGYNGRPVTFYYNTFIPRDTWYGFDLCNNAASSYKVTAQKSLILVILGFVISFWL
jgi:hypothetical protein